MLTEKTKTVKAGRRSLRTTSAICINGQIQTVGKIVEVSASEATQLIWSSRAVDASEAEVTAAAGNITIAPHRENSWTDA